jgi:hypothetical protein
VRQAVPQDCSFAEKQASPPALLVVVLSGGGRLPSAPARNPNECESSAKSTLGHFRGGLGLDGRERAAVDDVFGAGDRGGAVGDQEGDELGDLCGLGGSTERDSTEGVHDLL